MNGAARTPSPTPRGVVDPDLLARVAGLGVAARQLVEGGLTGQHKSPHHGSSVEFAQHREYAPGDEIRHIDWNAYARTDRYFIKQFEDETNLRAYLLLDTSGSMDYAHGGAPTKLVHAARLAATLGWLLLRQGDAVGLLTFGERLGAYVPPRARGDHFWNLVRAMESEPVGGQTDVTAALEHVAERASRRSVIVLLSDCFDFGGRMAAVARQLRSRKHRVVVFQVLDRAEVDFPFRDLTLFEDLESDDRALADPRGMRDAYLDEIRDYCEGLSRTLREADVLYHRAISDVPIERVLHDFVAQGGRR